MTKQSGFSLLELLIYMAIVGILIVTIGPRMISYLSEAKESKAASEIATFKMTIDQYYAKMGHYPQVLEDLIRKPANEPNWRRSLLDPETVNAPDGKILDPWNNPYVYRPLPQGSKPPYDLHSNGDPDVESGRIDAWKKK